MNTAAQLKNRAWTWARLILGILADVNFFLKKSNYIFEYHNRKVHAMSQSESHFESQIWFRKIPWLFISLTLRLQPMEKSKDLGAMKVNNTKIKKKLKRPKYSKPISVFMAIQLFFDDLKMTHTQRVKLKTTHEKSRVMAQKIPKAFPFLSNRSDPPSQFPGLEQATLFIHLNVYK